jgi:cytosine/adenosine deaminase-related metal-dependent hydrolase
MFRSSEERSDASVILGGTTLVERLHIRQARVVSSGPDRLPDVTDILVEDGIIVEIAPSLLADSAEVVEARGMLLAPGFVDTHRHIWQTQLRTVATDWSLLDYLANIRLVYSTLYTADDVYLGNYIGALEALDAGITTIVDHSHILNSPDHVEAAVSGLQDSGIRGTFCYGTFHNEPRVPTNIPRDPSWRYSTAASLRKGRLSSDDGLIQFGFAPYEAEGMPFEALVQEIAIARQFESAAVSCHVAMGAYDREHRLVERLAEQGLLGPDLLFVHGSTLTDREIELIREAGAGISSTPETELQMGMGFPVASRAFEANVRVGLGVDIVSNYSGDMFSQMRLGLQSTRAVRNRGFQEAGVAPAVITPTARSYLEMATLGGARAIRKDGKIGSIEVGKAADLILVSTDAIHMTPVLDPVGALVLNARPSDIDSVLVAGRFVKRGGKLRHADLARTRERFVASAAAIQDRLSPAYVEAGYNFARSAWPHLR